MNDCTLLKYTILPTVTIQTGFRIGDSAKNAFHSNPKNTVFDAKRLIGRKMEELEVKRDLKHLPFMVKEKHGAPMISVEYKDEMREFVCNYFFCKLFIQTIYLFSFSTRHLRTLVP